MLKLTILQGLPASGKSTFAKEQAKNERHTVIVNRDKIREMLKGEYKNFPFNSRMEELVTRIEDYVLEMSLMDNYNVISDNTNFRFTEAKALDICKKIKDFANITVTHEFIKFDTSLKECIERDKLRENIIGEDIITKMYNKYLKND
jgi:predicted kinase